MVVKDAEGKVDTEKLTAKELLSVPKSVKAIDIQIEMLKREQARRHLLDFSKKMEPHWQDNWHLKKIADALERVERGELKRLMIFMPPRHGKSQLGSINFPAWYLGRHPDREVVTCSYAAELSVDFGRKTRNMMMLQTYKNIFKTRLSEDSQSAQKWNTKENGGYYAVGVGGSLTGKGADILIIDDPIKNREEAENMSQRERTYDWFRSTAYTRLAPNGAVIVTQTRWHEADLAGKLLAESEEKWEVISFPAIAEVDEEFRKQGEALWPARYDVARLDMIKKAIGTYEWSSLYDQNPLNSEAQEFKRTLFKSSDIAKVKGLQTTNYLTIDTAVSQKDHADFTGFCINYVDRENFWHLKAWQAKITPLELIDTIFALHQTERFTKIGIERGVYSMTVKPFLEAEMRKRNVFLPIIELSHNQTQKEMRIRSLLPRYESGSIFHIAGYCDQLEDQLLRFPKGVHDDIIDAAAYMSQAVNFAAKSVTQFIPKMKTQSYRTIATKLLG